MVVAYYTSTNFMDVILETIQSVKDKVELHVFIEITNQSKNATIINVDSLEGMNFIEKPEKLLGKEKWAQFKPYFEGVASVHFIVHKNKRSLSFKTLKLAYSLGKYLKKYKIDVFHFDTISPRAIGLFSYLKKRKVVIALHDPVPHSGEDNWREDVPNFVFYRLAKSFIFYSKFAADQFKQYYAQFKTPLLAIKLQPYTFNKRYLSAQKPTGKYILFFGRLSYYKGIDLLLEAIPKVLEKYPDEKFIIAGKPSFGYEVDQKAIEQFPKNIEVVSRYLSTEELVQMIENSKFIVCPYRDATQSGVLMTSYAAGKMVLATNVGSFPEYIKDGVNGLLAEVTPESIAQKIIEGLDNNQYLRLEANVGHDYSPVTGDENAQILMQAYQHT
jgi:glycosyltransferase involved in cell wall biosynthesis